MKGISEESTSQQDKENVEGLDEKKEMATNSSSEQLFKRGSENH